MTISFLRSAFHHALRGAHALWGRLAADGAVRLGRDERCGSRRGLLPDEAAIALMLGLIGGLVPPAPRRAVVGDAMRPIARLEAATIKRTRLIRADAGERTPFGLGLLDGYDHPSAPTFVATRRSSQSEVAPRMTRMAYTPPTIHLSVSMSALAT
jgi:hypothetical protein